MNLFSFLKSFLKNQGTSPESINREGWTKEIFRLLIFTALIPVAIVLAATFSGELTFIEVIPILAVLILLLIGWQIIKWGGWRWAGLIPPIASMLLAFYGLRYLGFNYSIILVFAVSVVLAGVLQGNRTSILFVFLCTIIFAVVMYDKATGISVRFGVSILVTFSTLLILSIIQWYFFSRLRENIEAQYTVNRALEKEMSRRQQAEDVQHIQESQLSRLTNNMTDLVAEVDLTGKYLYASPSYYAVLNYKPEELLTINAFDLIHPADIPNVKAVIREVMETGIPSRIQYRVRHADGHYLWVESSGKFLDENPGTSNSLIFSTRDITQQKLAEENNQALEKKSQSIIDAIPMGMHMYSLENTADLIFYGYNPSANTILGIDHSELLGKKIENLFPGLKDTEIFNRYRQVARTGEPWTGEQVNYSLGKIDEAFDVHAFQTAPGKMAALFTDITEKMKTENALKLSEDKFSKAFHTSPDSININRLSDGMYIDINQGFTQLTGFEREDVIGKTSVELNIWTNLDDRARLVEGLKRDGVYRNLEADFQGKDGRIVHGLMSASLILVNGDQCLLNITRDISYRIQAEQKLKDAHSELEKAYEATLQGWASALELREHETADHSRRVVDMTVKIARKLNFDEEALVNIERGALLHDIGKMGVPDNILLKPGPLTSDEWVIMRQHPVYAYQLLKDVDYLCDAMEIPYCHHEHWDGTGYPRALKGEEIPLAARIFTLVDVWDALLSNRPYRPAWHKPTVMNYLQEQSGKLLDPEIVSLFLKISAEDTE